MKADDLTLARRATGSRRAADAALAELNRRHLDAVLTYAAQCTTTAQAAELLASAACTAAVNDFLAHGTVTAWRPHVLLAMRATAAVWARDDRQDRISSDF
ncbi:hypothetical protein [Streptomyces cucumeris]|uniref:hypothetical protein n=1 Tax=Streptomyces cucumeris TaxID=2962890 RepID=UPI003D72E44C